MAFFDFDKKLKKPPNGGFKSGYSILELFVQNHLPRNIHSLRL